MKQNKICQTKSGYVYYIAEFREINVKISMFCSMICLYPGRKKLRSKKLRSKVYASDFLLRRNPSHTTMAAMAQK